MRRFSGMVNGTREWRIYDVGGHRSLVSGCMRPLRHRTKLTMSQRGMVIAWAHVSYADRMSASCMGTLF